MNIYKNMFLELFEKLEKQKLIYTNIYIYIYKLYNHRTTYSGSSSPARAAPGRGAADRAVRDAAAATAAAAAVCCTMIMTRGIQRLLKYLCWAAQKCRMHGVRAQSVALNMIDQTTLKMGCTVIMHLGRRVIGRVVLSDVLSTNSSGRASASLIVSALVAIAPSLSRWLNRHRLPYRMLFYDYIYIYIYYDC